MRQSRLFTKTLKDAPKDEVSLNAQLLVRAGFVDKLMSGVYTFLPLGLRVLNKIQKIIREEIDAVGGQEILMSTLGPEENYKQTGRDVGMAEVLFTTLGAGETKLFLNPTHEEIVTPLVQKFTFSYRDLPVAVYQIQNKYRNEPRAKSGLLRGREFSMKDLYSFHASEEDLNNYYEKVKEAYFKIYSRLGIGDLTYLTFASGGTFSKYSHEFQTLCEAGEDIIYTCEKCKAAINKEIISEQNTCPVCGNKDLVIRKAIEVGNIFKQRTKFTSAFKFTYKDENGEEKPVEMAAYGIGPSRIMGTIVEVYHDDKGIIWPEALAPYQVHLISLCKTEAEKLQAEEIYQKLISVGKEVLFDDRDVSAGQKFADSDLIGIPVRYVVSSKTLEKGSVEVKERKNGEVGMMNISDI